MNIFDLDDSQTMNISAWRCVKSVQPNITMFLFPRWFYKKKKSWGLIDLTIKARLQQWGILQGYSWSLRCVWHRNGPMDGRFYQTLSCGSLYVHPLSMRVQTNDVLFCSGKIGDVHGVILGWVYSNDYRVYIIMCTKKKLYKQFIYYQQCRFTLWQSKVAVEDPSSMVVYVRKPPN